MADTARDAVDAVKTKVGDALDRGQAAVSHASDTASEMPGTATQQVKTFASELEAMAKRNPLGTIAGAVVSALLSVFWRAAVPPSVAISKFESYAWSFRGEIIRPKADDRESGIQ
jgi:hypothetical protein